MKYNFLYIIAAIILFASCGNNIRISKQTQDKPAIYPDYNDVTVPVNIAPLDFCVTSKGEYGLIMEGGEETVSIKADNDGNFEMPQSKWQKMLQTCKGGELKMTVCRKTNNGWEGMKPFAIHVADDSIDLYIAYRLIPPGYGHWREMGIYQRCLENYDETPIMQNKLTGYNCMNCHSFPARDPSRMVMHMRARNGGTLIYDNGKVEKLNTKTPETMSALVYPYWHPNGKYIAFSVNKTAQYFFMNHPNRIEVYDSNSDVVVYDVQKHEIISTSMLMDSARYETFPCFSPDGTELYFCSAAAVDTLPLHFRQAHYNLCRISFNVRKGTFGRSIETLYDAHADSMSVSFPRISPDGRYLCFTRHGFGTFSIWHKDADLWMMDLKTKRMLPMTAANSSDVESYHSWSSNSRWIVFSSRRGDGLYTRPYITYIDRRGVAHKPFLLPQRKPKQYYEEQMCSYNIPELIKGKVEMNRYKAAKFMREDKGTDISFREGL